MKDKEPATFDDIVKTVERFRILCVGRAGVGKSSLINRIFGVTGVKSAHVSDFDPGDADIEKEFVSEENKYFILHDSRGFEPGKSENFDVVADFVLKRSKEKLLKDRLHAVWLCTETPTAGGRVFETGDEKLLQLAHATKTPIVVVFTQYDKLVRTKKFELEEYHNIPSEESGKQSEEKAKAAYDVCQQSVEQTMVRLVGPDAPTLLCAKVSTRRTYEDTVSLLVEGTYNLVKDRLEGDAWIMWATAQRQSLPVKLDACINCMNRRWMVFAGSVPGLGQVLLPECIKKIHHDIITCWNFEDELEEILASDEFKQLMLYLVQDVREKRHITTRPSLELDPISQFVTLVTAASPAIAPPVAILGLTYLFLEWLSKAILENKPSVQQLLMAYTVDLLRVLRELFDFTLQHRTTLSKWDALKEAFAAYEYSSSRQDVHNRIRSNSNVLSPDLIDDQVYKLLAKDFRDT